MSGELITQPDPAAVPAVSETALALWGGEVPATVVMPDASELPLPAAIAELGPQASERYGTFFTDNIRNKNTRAAYGRAAARFFGWCLERGIAFEGVKSYHVSTYVEELGTQVSKPTVKQHLAAIRRLFDWLIVGQVCESNPAAAVRGPKHSVSSGKTPILDELEAKRLIESIPSDTDIGLRDGALIAVMIYTFARVEAVVGMAVEDYFPSGPEALERASAREGR